MYILETRNVRKVFGSPDVSVEALRGIDLAIRPGEFVAIMGPSGSGKSTLLHILGGIEVPSEGKVLLENRDLGALDDESRTIIRRRRIGFIFQSFNLLPTLSAEENVSLPLVLDGIPPAEAQQRAVRMMEHVSISHRRRHIPSKMSGGEQQRVAIARALVIEPALLLADEPTGNLDSVNGRQITFLLRGLVDTQQQTVIMVTHDPHVAAHADRIIHLRDGLIETEETNGPFLEREEGVVAHG